MSFKWCLDCEATYVLKSNHDVSGSTIVTMESYAVTRYLLPCTLRQWLRRNMR